MVEFCTACGTSLPKGDLTFAGGRVFTSHDYTCPDCGKLANPAGNPAAIAVEPGPDQDLLIHDGQVDAQS
jgi:hypothetical protein